MLKSCHSFILQLAIFSLLTFSTTLNASLNKENESYISLLPKQWIELQSILKQRLHQKSPKMKLTREEVKSLEKYLSELRIAAPNLIKLKSLLPKTTLELLRATHERNLPLTEAEAMAAYLSEFTQKQNFQNVNAFDENTSHIIGREWSEIDYTGEGMTWQNQRKKYLPHGITNFKSKENLIKFFRVESTLPYFRKIYRPHLGKNKGKNP